jgi:hypothetical protein
MKIEDAKQHQPYREMVISMGTISKKIADDVIAGMYDEDRPVKIVKYLNAWGGEAYGLICEDQPLDRYSASEYVINPVTYWEKENADSESN